jgi:hypothetical protein
VLELSYLYVIAFYVYYIFFAYLDKSPVQVQEESMEYMFVGTFMYILGEGVPLVSIFAVHYYKFVYIPNKLH